MANLLGNNWRSTNSIFYLSKRSVAAFFVALLATAIVLLNQRQLVALYPSFALELLALFILAPSLYKLRTAEMDSGMILLFVVCLALINSAFTLTEQGISGVESWIKLLLPTLLVPAVTRLCSTRIQTMAIFEVFFLFALVFAFYKSLDRSQVIIDTYGVARQTNWANVIGAISPFVFLIRQKWLRYVFLSLVALFLLIALKRSGLTVLLILVLLEVSSLLHKTLRFRKGLLYALVASASIAGGFFLAIEHNLFGVGDYASRAETRFQMISDDRGSGRLDVYGNIAEAFAESGFLKLLLGHGYGSSASLLLSKGRIQGMEVESAHNDFLEFLVSFGVLGAFLYVTFVVRITYVSIWVLRRCPEYAKFAAANLAVFGIYSLVAGTFFYYYFFVPLFVGIGFLEGIRRSVTTAARGSSLNMQWARPARVVCKTSGGVGGPWR
jgi:O-antigen ligase